MLLGTILLVTAVLAIVVALGASLRDLQARGRDPRRAAFAVTATYVALAIAGAALFALAGAFLLGNLDIHYVWANTDIRYSWFKRLSGLWVGRPGSLLLWAFFILAFWGIEEARHTRALRRGDAHATATAASANPPGPSRGAAEAPTLADTEAVRRVARPVILGVVLAMLVVVLNGRPFAPSSPFDLEAAQYGLGMNPQLLIVYNAIHPPIVFLGYAATLLPAAFGLAHLATGRPAWVGVARRWAHVAFFTLTIGVGLGALWAYIALGWGGYWDWDPVEVASLLPWLVITAFLHAAYRHDGKGQFPMAAPVLAVLAFAASMLSTLVVRSGVWVSLHSFLGEGDATNAWGRFLEAFNAQWEVRMFSLFLAAALLAIVALSPIHVRRIEAMETHAQQHGRPAAEAAKGGKKGGPLRHLNLSNLFVVGVLLLVLLTTVTITILFVGINGFPSNAMREAIYTERTAPIALAAIAVMGVAVSIGVLAKRTILLLLGGALAVGGLAALLLPDVWTLALAVPILAFAAGLAAVRIVLAWRRLPRRQAVRFAGIHTVHVGVALLLLGHGFVMTFEVFEDPVEMRVDDTRTVGPYELTLVALESRDTTGNNRHDLVTATFLVHEDGAERGVTTTGFQYYDFQSHYKPTVGLLRGLDRDVYFAPAGIHDPSQGWIFGNLPLPEQGMVEARGVDAITVRVATVPLINLVWGGALLMVFGAAALAASSWATPARTAPAPGSQPAGMARPYAEAARTAPPGIGAGEDGPTR